MYTDYSGRGENLVSIIDYQDKIVIGFRVTKISITPDIFNIDGNGHINYDLLVRIHDKFPGNDSNTLSLSDSLLKINKDQIVSYNLAIGLTMPGYTSINEIKYIQCNINIDMDEELGTLRIKLHMDENKLKSFYNEYKDNLKENQTVAISTGNYVLYNMGCMAIVCFDKNIGVYEY